MNAKSNCAKASGQGFVVVFLMVFQSSTSSHTLVGPCCSLIFSLVLSLVLGNTVAVDFDSVDSLHLNFDSTRRAPEGSFDVNLWHAIAAIGFTKWGAVCKGHYFFSIK
tara:strand:- start:484 stop:807 length:324 start_codon:yes stop_codon:yes gene_type:complete